MKVAFLASDKGREQDLAAALLAGAARHGHHTQLLHRADAPMTYDVACMVGVKSKDLFEAHRAAGIHVVYLDKGYVRGYGAGSRSWEYWRVAVDAHHPTRRLQSVRMPHDRLQALNLDPKPWRDAGDHILFAGSSAKYHAFYGLEDPNAYAASVVHTGRNFTDLPFVYRPKPSWLDARPVPDATFSPPSRSLGAELANAWALITHGSNACFEAILAGIPCVVLGGGVALPISSHTYGALRDPVLADDKSRSQWLANLAYFQWTLPEMVNGNAWDFLEGELNAKP